MSNEKTNAELKEQLKRAVRLQDELMGEHNAAQLRFTSAFQAVDAVRKENAELKALLCVCYEQLCHSCFKNWVGPEKKRIEEILNNETEKPTEG